MSRALMALREPRSEVASDLDTRPKQFCWGSKEGIYRDVYRGGKNGGCRDIQRHTPACPQSQSTDQVLYGWVNRLESDRGTEVMAGLKPERVNNNLFPSNIDPSPHQAFNQAVVIYLATKTGGN